VTINATATKITFTVNLRGKGYTADSAGLSQITL